MTLNVVDFYQLRCLNQIGMGDESQSVRVRCMILSYLRILSCGSVDLILADHGLLVGMKRLTHCFSLPCLPPLHLLLFLRHYILVTLHALVLLNSEQNI